MEIYLDSNAYISSKYKFDAGNMKSLVDLVKKGKVKVLYTDANAGEVYQHIEKDVTEGVTKHNRLYRKELAMIYNSDCELNLDDTIKQVKSRVKGFFDLNNVTNIPLNPLDANKLFEDYFSKNPPFEDKKPNEFKDAIMINAIKNYQKQENKQICIVSSDDGFLEAFENDSSFKTFQFLGYFLKYYNEQEKELNDLMEFTESIIKDEKYSNIFKEFIDDNYFISMDNYENWDCSDKEITDISYELLYIKKEEKKIYATISVDLDLKLNITYRDEEMSYYDKEEDNYLVEEYVHTIEKHKTTIDIEVSFDINDEKDREVSADSLKIVKDTQKLLVLDLDEDTQYDIAYEE